MLQPVDGALVAVVEELKRSVVDPGQPRGPVAFVAGKTPLLQAAEHRLTRYPNDRDEFEVGDREQPLELGENAG